ncbi:hypothetical protein C8R42DRAFT_553314, partial [Lentinula raphanica]
LTLAYAFTDYRAQGQTIVPVIIDIASPPTGALNLFNIYVALSRSSGRDNDELEKYNLTTTNWWVDMKNGR